LNLYLDATALVKRYVEEAGSDRVRQVMDASAAWFICRIGFVEAIRGVGVTAGHAAARAVREEWGAFGVVEVDQALVERAAELALTRDLRSLDALHLAAALTLPPDHLLVTTWDRRLHEAAREEGLSVAPEALT
jgi:predicted nucleic acid-binding protein